MPPQLEIGGAGIAYSAQKYVALQKCVETSAFCSNWMCEEGLGCRGGGCMLAGQKCNTKITKILQNAEPPKRVFQGKMQKNEHFWKGQKNATKAQKNTCCPPPMGGLNMLFDKAQHKKKQTRRRLLNCFQAHEA